MALLEVVEEPGLHGPPAEQLARPRAPSGEVAIQPVADGHGTVCHRYPVRMSRWEPNAPGRLEQAALELFAERGFEQTTVEDIARRAGLTRRTFFRHFPDKREVLFGDADAFRELFVQNLAAAPATAAPLDAVAVTLEAVGAALQHRHERARRRQRIIAATPELQERELVKLATVAGALAGGLRDRGVGEPAASVTAEAAIAVFRVAFERWVATARPRELVELVHESLDALREVTADDRTARPGAGGGGAQASSGDPVPAGFA